ncbi:hypothetical protein [Sphingomonas sp.]|uniref:hypothetical protein n=1 Tax=Sphingomonas sp. TaxID=28214 RepID=UPI001B10B894|nr:hypothetical protein [Sphingomonas sp.]MBO9714411.1 hypothetical protein [Sphingomonas sp.]
MTLGIGQWTRLALASTAALGLAACNSDGSYRVASVGTTAVGAEPDNNGGDGSGSGSGTAGGGSAGGSGSASGSQGGLGSKVLVSSGNAVMGLSGTQAGLTAGIPGGGVVDATVTGTLKSTGQTLVQLGSGGTLVLDGNGGKLGDVVSLDLGQGKVIGSSNAGSPLVGLNVLAKNPTTGSLVTVGGANNNLVSVTAPGTGTGGLLNGTGGVLGGTGGNASVTGAVGNTLNTTLNGAVNPSGKSGVSSVTNVVTQPVSGVLNVTGGTPPK